MNTDEIQFVLASASPRRAELLQKMACKFLVQSADIDESQHANEPASDYVSRLAQTKAKSVRRLIQNQYPNLAVLAADTIVVQDNRVFGKPTDQQQAFQMWQQLANSKHRVMTSICLAATDRLDQCTVSTIVEFHAIDQNQMHRYWQTGEPLDKAGGYAIQGFASAWVKLIHGSYSNVVGLPLYETNVLLKQIRANWL